MRKNEKEEKHSVQDLSNHSRSLPQDGGPKATIEPCGLLASINDECVKDVCNEPSVCTLSQTSERSGEQISRSILRDMLRKATRVRVKKEPKMKSGWMDLQTRIPDFLIDDDVSKKIAFGENLLVSAFRPEQTVPVPVGGLSLSVQEARGGPLKYQPKKTKSDYVCPKFLVHLSSKLDFVGNSGGSRITAWVDRSLQTLEEKRREFLQLKDELDQQVLYVSSQENFYYLRNNKKKDIFYSPRRAENLICEGANFVLMRYLALTLFVGTFELSTLYIDGSLCRNIYECKGPSSGIVNNQKLDVCKIYRTVVEQCGNQHRSITLMTLDGQILKQEWYNCDYILQINPLRDVSRGKASWIPLEHRVQDDLQLLSLYLDAKTLSKKLIRNYMEDHPEIKDMLADYLQTILQLKPEDVFEFTAKYFLAFTPHLLLQSEYFEGPRGGDEDDDFDFWKYL